VRFSLVEKGDKIVGNKGRRKRDETDAGTDQSGIDEEI
jgi:hypothetical protein